MADIGVFFKESVEGAVYTFGIVRVDENIADFAVRVMLGEIIHESGSSVDCRIGLAVLVPSDTDNGDIPDLPAAGEKISA